MTEVRIGAIVFEPKEYRELLKGMVDNIAVIIQPCSVCLKCFACSEEIEMRESRLDPDVDISIGAF